MSLVEQSIELAPNLYEMTIKTRIARRAQAGQFVIAMASEDGERIPLTIADYDREAETITLVVMVVGVSSQKIVDVKAGEKLHAIIGPLGEASHLDGEGKVVVVAGGVGTAPVFPIARALHDAGREVIGIQGAQSAERLFWKDRMEAVCDELIVTTDDGSVGQKALVTEPLKEMLEKPDHGVGRIVAIGPIPMMRAVAETTRPFDVETIVSLNTIMVDGTGMCGGCRVEVGGKTKFTCVDGPEFDGHHVDWAQLANRQRVYHEQERCSLRRYESKEELRG